MYKIDKFDETLKKLLEDPISHCSLRTESEKIAEVGNCTYHRSKLRELYNQYNKAMTENMRLKDSNYKLAKERNNLIDRV